MRKQTQTLLVSLLTVLLLASCASTREKIVYVNDMDPGKSYPFNVRHEATIHRDDRLSIVVSCKNPELAIPFNSVGYQTTSSGNVVSADSKQGYRVDIDGCIEFPILGKLDVEGMTVSDMSEMIKRKIIEGDYIKDPQVSVEFLNFKYTVMGAVAKNGTFSVDGDRITLLEAIANAGDLTSKACLDRVNVIREEGDERKMYVHDIRSTKLFESPCFYLQQNDIVYVEPKYRKKDGESRGWQIWTAVMALISAVGTIIWATK